jgi:recombination protein RecA
MSKKNAAKNSAKSKSDKSDNGSTKAKSSRGKSSRGKASASAAVSAGDALIENNPNLKNTLQQIEKEFGEGSIMPLGAAQQGRIKGISTGCLSLDLALGGQGIPRGRVIEMFGPESSGKTTLALHVVAQAQAAGGIAAFIDAEHALDPSWAKKIGCRTRYASGIATESWRTGNEYL